MTEDDICILERSVDRTVRLKCTYGELIVAKIDLVDCQDRKSCISY